MKTMIDMELVRAIAEAFDVNTDNVRRVVIDVQVGETPIVHIEQYADKRILNVVRALDGVRVEREDRPAL